MDSDSLKAKGNEALKAGDIESAISHYTTAINIDENNHTLYSNRCLCYTKLQRWNEAYGDANKTVILAPDWGKGYLRKGTVLIAKEKYTEAKHTLARGLQKEPENEQMKQLYRQAVQAEQHLLFEKGEKEKKMLLLKEKGNNFLGEGSLEEAVTCYTEAIEIDDKNHVLFSNRCVCYIKLEEYEKALKDAERTVFLAPTWSKGYGRLGASLHFLGRYEESVKAYQKGLSRAPDDATLKKGVEDAKAAAAYAAAHPNQIFSPTSKDNIVKNDTSSVPKKDEGKSKNTTSVDVSQVKDEKTGPEKNETNDKDEEKENSKGKEKEKKNGKEKKSEKEEEEEDEVEEVEYYSILGVERDATDSQIKKAYYKRARDFHPDKNADNPESEVMFKLVSEAYTVLSDPEKKKFYDKNGYKATRDLEEGGVSDPSILFRMIFGGGAFDDSFGELIFGILAKQAMDPENAGKTEEELAKALEEGQEKRQEELVEELIKKLELYVSGKDKNFSGLKEEIEEKLEAPGGIQLLSHLGYIYISEGKKNMGRFFGVEGFFANVQQTGHNIKATFSVIHSAVKMQQTQAELERAQEEAAARAKEREGGETPNAPEEEEEEDLLAEELGEEMMSQGMGTIWKMGKMEIENTVRSVCEKALNKDKSLKKKRAGALKALGELYSKESRKAKKERGIESPYLTRMKEETTSSSSTSSTSSTTTKDTSGAGAGKKKYSKAKMRTSRAKK